MYSFIVNRRNKLYDTNKAEIVKCSVPVISIGNLAVGGTGKTPAVIKLCQVLLNKGYKPAVVGRGYKRKSKGLVVVSDGVEIKADAEAGGDEMYLIAQKFNIPVVAHSSKSDAALFVSKNFNVDYIIVDDGFQHRRLYRDYDIVLLSKDNLLNPKLLPFGRLREPLKSLKRADIICLTKGADFELFKAAADSANLYQELKNKQFFECSIKFGKSYNLMDNSEFSVNKSNNIIAVSAIANPQSFFSMLSDADYNIAASKSYPDHYNYTVNSINDIIKLANQNNSNIIAATEKDAVKLKSFVNLFKENNINIVVFPLDFSYKKI